MNSEQIRARQLMEDLEIQARELKEEITFEMTEAITRSLEQSYTLGQEDLKKLIIKTFKNQGILLPKKNITLAELIKNCDIRVTKTGNRTKLKTEQ